jgi:oligopeptidase B
MHMHRRSSRREFMFGLGVAGTVPLSFRPVFGLTFAEAATSAEPVAPIAPIVRKVFEKFGGIRIDNYDWLRDRKDPRVITYLEAENAYADTRLASIKPLIEELVAELKEHEALEDRGVPAALNGYVYERRFARGAQYPTIIRRRDAPDALEEIVLDVGVLAANHTHQCQLGSWTISPDNARVAFALDFEGGNKFHIFVRAIATGEIIDKGIDNAASSLAFAADSETLFYVRNEPTTLRSYQVWRHRIGETANSDLLVYGEDDSEFSVSIELSKSRKFIFLNIEEERTSEVRYLPTDQPTGEPKLIEPRRRDVSYEVEHVGDQFFIRTNLGAPDFRIMRAPEHSPEASNWIEVVAQKTGHYLRHFEISETFVAVDIEDESGTSIHVFSLPDLSEIPVPRLAPFGVASTSFPNDNEANLDPAVKALRFRFSAPLQPECIYDFEVRTGVLTLRKEDPASRWFDRDQYEVNRLSATAQDGEQVPVTIIYHKAKRRLGGNPMLIVGYGAYGLSWRATFTSSIFSLLNRGFVYAIAHVRGGHEKGDRWYAEGRMLNKCNTFTDFIAATKLLIAEGYADQRAVFARGGSAGGLLVGAIANLRPDLYAGIVAEAPFVDVVTTMSDTSIPLTTLEYEEWGNPAIKQEYEYLLSYSPYDNVTRKAYPAMFVTAGFHDTQVSYAEPAKWVARLRANKTDRHELLFKTDMEAGHSGRSGRLGSIEETAQIMGWLITHADEERLR